MSIYRVLIYRPIPHSDQQQACEEFYVASNPMQVLDSMAADLIDEANRFQSLTFIGPVLRNLIEAKV